MSVLTAPRRNAAIDAGRRPAAIVALTSLLGLLTIGALQGGIAMVANPTEPLGMTVEYLVEAPIDDYFLPGLFLLGIAAASTITIAGLTFGWRWSWASPIESRIGYRWPWLGAVSIGGILLVFEIVELFMVPFHPVMHPLLIAGSMAILILALTPSARRYLVAR
jgi:hypothetical protein